MAAKTISDKYADEVEKNTQLSEQLKTVQAEADKVPGLEQKVTDLEAKVTELTEAAEQAKTDHEEAIAEKDEIIQAKYGEIATLQGKLAASPAHIQVAGADPVTEQAGAGGEGEFTSKADALKAYNKIEDPKAREDFREKHAKILELPVK